mmetsp:Transcript_46143/g.111843  ORF Transcript_46143/g.111843 Transcript_46143/m.111843 type:complete len:368 (-) Transcript_46143:4293-5396(-)
MKVWAFLALQATSVAAFTTTSHIVGGASSRQQHQRSSTSSLDASALIIQNKGGGHGELGYQLAKVLQENYKDKITNITILQDEDCDMEKEPFKSYGVDLEGVEVNYLPIGTGADWIDMHFMQNMLGGKRFSFEYVFDNASKKPVAEYKALVDCAAEWENLKMYCYVSSAGMYTPDADGPFPMPETTAVKESSGQYQFEQYVLEKKLPLVSFRPQYIYGEKANKFDYLDYYFEYILKDAPVPIPGDGSQIVSLTNSKDVACLLASVLDKEEEAIAQRYFNCGTDQLVSYKEVAELCAKAASVSNVQIESTGDEKGDFPFRATNFYVAPDMAKEKLGWEGAKNKLEDDLSSWYYKGYKERKPFIDAVVE